LQLERKDSEFSLKEAIFKGEVDELSMELAAERRAIRFVERALNEKEKELKRALGRFNEKGEELDMLTAQVRSICIRSGRC
jgi:chromosome segregation ATPase